MSLLRTMLSLCLCLVSVTLLGCSAKEVEPKPAQESKVQTPTPVEPTAPGSRYIDLGDGRKLVVNDDSKIEIRRTHENSDRAGSVDTDQKATSKGPALSTSSAEVAQKFNVAGQELSLDQAKGGGFTYDGKLFGGAKVNVFHMIGASLLLVGLAFIIVPMVFGLPPRYGTAAMIAAGGVGFIAIGSSLEAMPWAWAIAGLIILAIGGVWVFMAVRHGQKKSDLGEVDTVLGSIVTTVSKGMSAASRADFKTQLGKVLDAQGPEVKKIVEAWLSDAKIEKGI